MNHHFIDNLSNSVQTLYTLLRRNIGTDNLETHPFDLFPQFIQNIQIEIQTSIYNINEKIKNQKIINSNLKQRVLQLAELIEIEVDDFQSENVIIEFEYWKNEEARVLLRESRIKGEIEEMIACMARFKGNIYNISEPISSKLLSEIKGLYSKCLEEIEELKEKRSEYIKAIIKGYKRLQLECYDEKDLAIINDYTAVGIEIVAEKYNYIVNEVSKREACVIACLTQIEDLRESLFFHFNLEEEISNEISDNNINRLESILKSLKEEEAKYFESIFSETYNELKCICQVFEMEMVGFEKTKDNLQIMKKIIAELSAKKEKFLQITSLIQKREDLIKKMVEFEKSASDPRRLFKSSFQLIHEEKFRKTAYPNLLRIEQSINDEIDEYQRIFDDFVYKGAKHRKVLEDEIENRIINRNVFIMNKHETPKKKY